MRIALGLEYDGRRFCGWQTQREGCGVQDALERALERIGTQRVIVVAAGRTDRGVHAEQQVIHFDCDVHRPSTAWVRGTNAHLPAGVAVLWARHVSENFHARFSAVERHYHYRLLNRPVRPGLDTGRVGWYHARLDVVRMRRAAQALVGVHDFSAFRSSECQAKSPIRDVREIQFDRSGDMISLRFRANAFLHHMVRNIVGALIWVGSGKQEPEWIKWLLEQRDRRQAAPTFSAEGLYLARIVYDGDVGKQVAGPGWNEYE